MHQIVNYFPYFNIHILLIITLQSSNIVPHPYVNKRRMNKALFNLIWFEFEAQLSWEHKKTKLSRHPTQYLSWRWQSQKTFYRKCTNVEERYELLHFRIVNEYLFNRMRYLNNNGSDWSNGIPIPLWQNLPSYKIVKGFFHFL